jgi:hypothetical protein
MYCNPFFTNDAMEIVMTVNSSLRAVYNIGSQTVGRAIGPLGGGGGVVYLFILNEIWVQGKIYI